jgi:2-polyprenyl-3-methyl-5-hydroxy-6-metoxy-1,4-benzoquinol methylase
MLNPRSEHESCGAPGSHAELAVADCDLCRSADAVEIYKSNIEQGVTAIGEHFSSSRRSATHGRIVRCESCGLVRTSPRDTLETLETVYTRLEDPLYDAETANRVITVKRELDFIEQFTPVTGRLLDVGCSTGIFLAAARDRGWIVDGIEASDWAVSLARERFGLEQIRQGFVEDIEFEPASFDVITLWDVLEHVHSPTGVLDRLNGWLKPGGLLFVNVPNVESTAAAVLRRWWPLLLREHLWYFSPRTLDMALSKTGFRVRRTRPNRVTFSLANVSLRLGQYGGRVAPAWRRIARSGVARALTVSFPIGEMMAAACKEP